MTSMYEKGIHTTSWTDNLGGRLYSAQFARGNVSSSFSIEHNFCFSEREQHVRVAIHFAFKQGMVGNFHGIALNDRLDEFLFAFTSIDSSQYSFSTVQEHDSNSTDFREYVSRRKLSHGCYGKECESCNELGVTYSKRRFDSECYKWGVANPYKSTRNIG